MPYGPDPKKPHEICIHGSGGGTNFLPENFPLDDFLKKSTCKKNEETKMYDCYFDYDPGLYKRSGEYKEWDGSVILYILLGSICLLIVAFIVFYFCVYSSSSGSGHGGSGSGGGNGACHGARSGLASKSKRSSSKKHTSLKKASKSKKSKSGLKGKSSKKSKSGKK